MGSQFRDHWGNQVTTGAGLTDAPGAAGHGGAQTEGAVAGGAGARGPPGERSERGGVGWAGGAVSALSLCPRLRAHSLPGPAPVLAPPRPGPGRFQVGGRPPPARDTAGGRGARDTPHQGVKIRGPLSPAPASGAAPAGLLPASRHQPRIIHCLDSAQGLEGRAGRPEGQLPRGPDPGSGRERRRLAAG